MRAYDRIPTCTRCGAYVRVGTDGNGRLVETVIACRCPTGPTAPTVCTVCDEPVERPGLCERCERKSKLAGVVMSGTRTPELVGRPKAAGKAKVCPDCGVTYQRPGASRRCLECAERRRGDPDRRRDAEIRRVCEIEGCTRPRREGSRSRYCVGCAGNIRRERERARDRALRGAKGLP